MNMGDSTTLESIEDEAKRCKPMQMFGTVWLTIGGLRIMSTCA